MGDSKQFKYRIVKCEEIKYKTDIAASMAIDSDKLSFGFGFKIKKVDENKASVLIVVSYEYGSSELLRHESSTTFEFENMAEVIEFSDGSKVGFHVDILPVLFGLAYSSARGMLAIRTAGTALENYPIPIVDPTEVVNGARL